MLNGFGIILFDSLKFKIKNVVVVVVYVEFLVFRKFG